MNAGDEMVQTMKILYQGVEYTLRLSGALVKNAALLIAALLHKQSEKPSVGKTNLINMLKDGDAIKVLQFNDSDLSNFCRLAKDYGFPVVPVKNRAGNELGNVLVREKDAEQINAALNALGFAKMQMQEQKKNIHGTPPPFYSNGRESNLGRRRSETPRIGEGAERMGILQMGDQRHGDFVPAYCYPPEPVVIYADPPKEIPLLGDGLARKKTSNIVYVKPKERKALGESQQERQLETVVLPESDYQALDSSVMERQKREPLVFLQNDKTRGFVLFSPSLLAAYQAQKRRPIMRKERRPSVKMQLAHFAAKLKEQAKDAPSIQQTTER